MPASKLSGLTRKATQKNYTVPFTTKKAGPRGHDRREVQMNHRAKTSRNDSHVRSPGSDAALR